MPDSADNGRPSAAPLSVEDADRLADSFTAFWDDEPPAPTAAPPVAAAPPAPEPPTAGAPPAAAAPSIAAAPVSFTDSQPFGDPELAPVAVEAAPLAGTVTQPMPAVAPVARTKPLGKQTLVGIAPISIEKSPAAEAPPPSSPIQSSPSPAVPGYAIAYTPKDSPSTPAVVIAPEAQSAPDNAPPEDRRALSQTVPSRVRSAPNASLSPPPPPPAAQDDDFNPYAPKKGKGKVIGLMIGGTLLVAVSALAVRGLGDNNRESPTTPSAASSVADVVRAATGGATAPTPEPNVPEAAPAPTTTARESEPVAARPATERAPAKAKAKAKAEPLVKVRTEPVASPVARAATRTPSAEASPPAPRPASKGVIVRDAPF